MAKLSKEDLNEDYEWTNVKPDDPRVSGVPDDTHFNASEGHEALYLINTLMSEWDLRNKKSGLKMERMLRDLPSEVRSQADIKIWIKDKWKSYKFKAARRKVLQPPAHPATETTQKIKKGGKDHHFCPNCTRITKCKITKLTTSDSTDTSPQQELSGIHYFKRYRKCANCNSEFETVEIDSSMLYELIRLRSIVDKIKSELNAS